MKCDLSDLYKLQKKLRHLNISYFLPIFNIYLLILDKNSNLQNLVLLLPDKIILPNYQMNYV